MGLRDAEGSEESLPVWPWAALESGVLSGAIEIGAVFGNCGTGRVTTGMLALELDGKPLSNCFCPAVNG